MAVQTIPARLRWAVDFIDVQPQDHILEIGCGSGQAADLICRRLEGRGKLFAIDRSEAVSTAPSSAAPPTSRPAG